MQHHHFLKQYFRSLNSLAAILLITLTQQAFFNTAPIVQAAGQLNIRLFTPDNWSASVVVSSEEGNFSQQELFIGTDNYINWGMINDGPAIQTAFTNCLYFDGEPVRCWEVESLDQGEIFTVNNWPLTNEVQTGSHFIQLLIDVNNDLNESSETDNQWEFDFTWLPNDSIAQPYVDAIPFNDMLTPSDYPELTAQNADFSEAPGYYNTSSFMIGSVAVGIVLPESAGNGENWTSTEQQQVVTEIQAGLDHWKSWGGASANLSFVYEIKYNVATTYEPISKPIDQHCPWISEVMTNIGFPGAGGPCLLQSRDYINDLRTRKGTDWAFVIFVVDSSQDADGRFSDGYFGYAYRGGPYLVMPYDNASLGITAMDRITAHETGHIFYAADNYYISGYGGCESKTEKYGYLGISNSNCQKNNPGANLYTLMGKFYDKVYSPHSTTKQQVGWRDSDGDLIFDPVDTIPQINITTQPADTSTNIQLTYGGSAYDQPYPSADCPVYNNCSNQDVTINKIVSVKYRVDGGTWLNVSAYDGLFNSDQELFTFTTTNLVSGIHIIDIMTTNSLGTTNNPYWTDTVIVQTVPQPPANFGKIAPNGIVLGANNAILTWNTSFGAANYAYCYDTTNDGACSNWINVGTQTNATINGLTQETAYYWQVRASNNFGITYADNNIFWMFNSGTPLSNVKLVVPNGLSSGTCSSWQYACDLKYAFTQVISGNEIWVAAGTYTPGTLQVDTFQLKNGVAVYGGFTGAETSRNQRDALHHITILSGDLAHNDLPNFVNKNDNCYHVVTGSGTDNTALLDGFTISGGYANSSTPNNFGGGIFNVSGNPTLNNLIFSGNVARMGGGGGMYNEYSSPLMTNILFDNNLAEKHSSWGGWGGGIYNAMSSPVLKNIMFSSNQAISLENGSGGWGGAVYNYQSSPTFINATFYSNHAGSGGGVFNDQSNPLFTNVTFSENSVYVFPEWSGGAGGGIFNKDSNPEIRNTIMWGNTALTEAQLYNDTTSAPIIRYSILESGCPAGSTCLNNILDDPLLGEAGNYSGFTLTIPIEPNSPAIDSGNNTYCPATDQREINRPGDGNSDGTYVCDIGAFEFEMVPEVLSITRTNTNPTNAASIDFTVTFSEAVTGVDVSDFNLTTNSISDAAVSGYSGSGSIYTVTVYTGTSNGSIRLNVMDDNTIVDMILNSLGTGFTNGETYKVIKSATFTDVPFTYWAWNYTERLFSAGITGGCGTGIYCPDSTVTRAQMAVFLLKGMHGSNFTPPAINGSTNFTDVATTHWAAAWIKQLAAEGITSGCGNGNYCPEATVTRAQMAIFLLKAKHGSSYLPSAATGVFTDVPVGYWADKWIERLAVEGVTSGCGNGNYCPEDSVTRAQMAVFLVKAFALP